MPLVGRKIVRYFKVKRQHYEHAYANRMGM